jgi:hypothetical protein
MSQQNDPSLMSEHTVLLVSRPRTQSIGGGQPRKSKQGDLSRRLSSRDSTIRIFDLGPSHGVMGLPVGVASAVFDKLA